MQIYANIFFFTPMAIWLSTMKYFFAKSLRVLTWDTEADSSPVVSYAKIARRAMLKTDSKDDWGRVRYRRKNKQRAIAIF